MVRGEAGRGLTCVLCVVTRPALLVVAHVGEAAQEAAAWVADAAQRLHNERDNLELLDLQRVVGSSRRGARRRSPRPCGGRRARRQESRERRCRGSCGAGARGCCRRRSCARLRLARRRGGRSHREAAAARGTRGGGWTCGGGLVGVTPTWRWHPLCCRPSASASRDSQSSGETADAEAEMSTSSAIDGWWAPRHMAAPEGLADDIADV